MARYADITPFYEWLEELMRLDTSSYPDHNTLMFYEIFDELDSLPELIRCKDCRFGVYAGLGKFMCDAYEFVGKADFYCASGERKDNE